MRGLVRWLLLVLPLAMVGLAGSYLTLLAVGKGDHLIWLYAISMVVLTVLNLWGERHERR